MDSELVQPFAGFIWEPQPDGDYLVLPESTVIPEGTRVVIHPAQEPCWDGDMGGMPMAEVVSGRYEGCRFFP